VQQNKEISELQKCLSQKLKNDLIELYTPSTDTSIRTKSPPILGISIDHAEQDKPLGVSEGKVDT
jgi:hypothetical protein